MKYVKEVILLHNYFKIFKLIISLFISKDTSNLWSFVTSVVQMAARRSENDENEMHKSRFQFTKSTLLQKAASFAEFLKKQCTLEKSPQPTTKRRRMHDRSVLIRSPTSPIRKLRKIHGRKPIERMRK